MKVFEMKNVYEAYTNSDLNEGRGHDVTIAYFVNEGDAEMASRGKGVFGSDAHVRSVDLKTVVYESLEEYAGTKQKTSRNRLSRSSPPKNGKPWVSHDTRRKLAAAPRRTSSPP